MLLFYFLLNLEKENVLLEKENVCKPAGFKLSIKMASHVRKTWYINDKMIVFCK